MRGIGGYFDLPGLLGYGRCPSVQVSVQVLHGGSPVKRRGFRRPRSWRGLWSGFAKPGRTMAGWPWSGLESAARIDRTHSDAA